MLSKQNKKIVIALFLSLLMFSSVFGMISYIKVPNNSPQASQIAQNQISSIGETGSTSVNVNYWSDKSVSNSATTTDTLSAVEASTQQSAEIDSSSTWSLSSNSEVATISVNMGDFQVWTSSVAVSANTYATSIACVQLYSLQFEEGQAGGVATIGNVWANLTVNGAKYVWNDNINSGGNTFGDISPTWTNVAQDGTSFFENGYYSVSLQIQMTTDSSNTWSSAPECLLSYSGSSSQNGESGTDNVPSYIHFITGWTYSGVSCSSTFTIPQYTTSYNIDWSTTESG